MRLSRAVFVLAFVKFAVHVTFIHGYGIFRDELYYLACSRHLAWGYVEFTPLLPFVTRLITDLFGESLFAIRILPAICGAALVILTGMLARELGGGRWAQIFAALSVVVAPMWLAIDHTLQTNAMEPLFWMGCALVFIRIVNTGNQRLWLWFGVLAGLGLMNKHSMLFFGFAFAVSILLARDFQVLRSKWFWLAAGVAALMFLPNVIWQIANDFPTAEFLENAAARKNAILTVPEFFLAQVLPMNPLTFPVWITGLGALLFWRRLRPYRIWGWLYLVLYVTFSVLHGKNYYLTPAYPMLLAAGSLVFERFRFKPLIAAALAVSGLIVAPMAIPILPVESYIRYAAWLGIEEKPQERHVAGRLPQYYADMFGWKQMVERVAEVYYSLAPEERAKTGIYGSNYGEAAAIDYFGPRLGLPPGMSGHNNYWIWGPKGSCEILIVIGGKDSDHHKAYDDVVPAGKTFSPYAMPYENNRTIWICRKPRFNDVRKLWPRVKEFI